jgi:hypothetical protein
MEVLVRTTMEHGWMLQAQEVGQSPQAEQMASSSQLNWTFLTLLARLMDICREIWSSWFPELEAKH